MERAKESAHRNKLCRQGFDFVRRLVFSAVALGMISPSAKFAQAGLAFSGDSSGILQSADPGFPESRFGQQSPGVASDDAESSDDSAGQFNNPKSPHFAAQQTEAIDSTEDDLTGGRKPAGLEFSSTGNGFAPRNPAEIATLGSNSAGTSLRHNSRSQAMADAAGSALDSASRRAGTQEVALIASDLGYFPRMVFVAPNVPVRMYVTGASKSTLCIMMDSFQVKKQVRSQRIEEISFMPDTPGRYRFYCPVNGMEGTLVVKELPPEPSPQEAVPAPASSVRNAPMAAGTLAPAGGAAAGGSVVRHPSSAKTASTAAESDQDGE